jgi:Bacterial membrane protein YfhO
MTTRIKLSPDLASILILIGLWLWFFWRLFTPMESDQASLEKGDFSGQFVAFGAYQYQRFAQGEIPLWNPYNNGGLPFLADTQSAVFYPPRLITIGLSALSGGWTYHALELEMTFHVLLYSLMMYALVRRLTLAQPGSVIGGLVAAIVAAYSGFLSGYPPLQLALLEAGIWLPLAILGITEATRGDKIRWRWLVLAGFAYGLSWMAGHPQTSWFLTYLLIAYLAYRAYIRNYRWTLAVFSIILFGAIGGGMAAVQLLPGLEYLPQTARVGFTYDAKGSGFPFQDIIQFVFPGMMTLFSPLYVGIVGLALALIAIWRKLKGGIFWGLVAVIALGLSFGANSAVFPLFYNLLPGLRFFRGQERAAYLVSNSLAILAGLGTAHLLSWNKDEWTIATKNLQRGILSLSGICGAVVALVFTERWLAGNLEQGQKLGIAIFSALISVLLYLLIREILSKPQAAVFHGLLIALIVFELFTVSMDTESNYDPVPPTQQLSMTPPPLVAQVLADDETPFRVDGFRGLNDNFGSLYSVMDMRGISPLFLEGPYQLIEPEKINPLAWELFAVRYVYTDWAELPVESEIIGAGEDRYGAVNLHRLSNPRPFAHLMYDVEILDSDEFAYALLHDPNFDARETVILNRDPDVTLDTSAPEDESVIVTSFEPESFTVTINTPADAILSLAHPDYPGWQATMDGEPVEILRAYGALAGIAVPEGEHEIRFVYDPLSYRIGAILSLLTWGSLAIFGVVVFLQRNKLNH